MLRHLQVFVVIMLSLAMVACAGTFGRSEWEDSDGGKSDAEAKKDQLPPDQLYSSSWAGPSQTATGWRLNYGR